MKKYIIITCSIHGVGGGQLYTKNKAQYMENKGYEVFVFYKNLPMGICIEYLKSFGNGYIPELSLNFCCLSKKRIKKTINKMLKCINYKDEDEIIIESHELYLSMWGEELAKYVNCKHIVFSLAEKNAINDSTLRYTEFKFQRGELATINEKTFSDLYKISKVIHAGKIKKLIAFLGDPVEEYNCPELDNLHMKDKNICIFGRMIKPYVLFSCKKISEYVVEHPKTIFSVTVLGTKDEKVISQINSLFERHDNLFINFIDSLTPVPRKVFSMFDLIIGSSGCASLPYRQGALTLCMDIHNVKALGFMGYDIVKSIGGTSDSKEFSEYLDEALFTKDYLNRNYIEPNFPTKEECFSEHDVFCYNSVKEKEYFNFKDCVTSKKEKIKTALYLILGIERAKKNLELLRKFF